MKRLFSLDDDKRIQYLQQLIAQKTADIKNAPRGFIKIQHAKGRVYYYYYKSHYAQSSNVRYLRANDARDMALARAIAQRGYDEKILKLATEELKLLQKEDAFYQTGCVDDLYDSLNKGRRKLITPIRLTDKEYIAKWLAQAYPRKGFAEGAPSFETKRGEKVRSKSEVMIADDLYLDDIPYLYEKPIQVIDLVTGRTITLHPDFTILNVRERKTFLWEHLGKCDDPDYMAANVKKLIEYENAGYRLGDNLIVTFETRSFPLTPERVRATVEYYLK